MTRDLTDLSTARDTLMAGVRQDSATILREFAHLMLATDAVADVACLSRAMANTQEIIDDMRSTLDGVGKHFRPEVREKYKAAIAAGEAACRAYETAGSARDAGHIPEGSTVTLEDIKRRLTVDDMIALRWLRQDGKAKDRGNLGHTNPPEKATLDKLADWTIGDPRRELTFRVCLCEQVPDLDWPREFDEHWRLTPLGIQIAYEDCV